MRAWSCAVLLLLVAGQAWSQEPRQRLALSGETKTEVRSVEPFSQIDLAAIGKVEIAIGDEFRVQVTADSNILPHVTTELVAGRLRLGLADGLDLPDQTEIRFVLHMPRIERAIVSGAGDLELNGELGSAVELELSGAGTIRAQGKVAQVSAIISGAGNLELHELAADNATVVISGAGNARVHASGSLEATISGVGDVLYRGAAHVQARVTGIGHVRNTEHPQNSSQGSAGGANPQ